MNYKYGDFIVGKGSIEASAGASSMYHVLTAGENLVEMQYADYWGGSGGQTAGLFLVPPNAIAPNTEPVPGSVVGCISITAAGYAVGGAYTADAPATFAADNGGRGVAWNPKLTIPPYWSVYVASPGSSAAAWYITVGGFELV